MNHYLIKYNDCFYSEPFLNKLMWIQMKFGNGRSTDWLENMINVQDFQHLWLWLNSSIRLQNRSGRKLAEEKRKIVNSLPAYFFILINNNINYILFYTLITFIYFSYFSGSLYAGNHRKSENVWKGMRFGVCFPGRIKRTS